MNEKGKNIGWIVAVVVLIVGFLGVVIWRMADKKANQVDYSKYDVNSIIAGNEDNGGIGDHVKGSADAPVVIYEYADYQCSGCASANPRVNKLLTEYDGKLAVVYRNFLLSYHQNGTAAASAAEAAGLQGYFKEYADKLFANQSVWSSATGNSRTDMFVDLFRNVTGGEGDEEKFIADMGSAEVKAKIDFDTGLSEDLDIPGTPSFFLNGERIDLTNVSTEDEFMKLMREKIDAALKAAK
ncbi:thioredoxin domain-containing protein [Candidatus Saccharibacteria bacterium]|nr:thioredoxin domain-containing protein [Candidatus Saccharibacteria bacterium]